MSCPSSGSVHYSWVSTPVQKHAEVLNSWRGMLWETAPTEGNFPLPLSQLTLWEIRFFCCGIRVLLALDKAWFCPDLQAALFPFLIELCCINGYVTAGQPEQCSSAPAHVPSVPQWQQDAEERQIELVSVNLAEVSRSWSQEILISRTCMLISCTLPTLSLLNSPSSMQAGRKCRYFYE